MPRHRPFTVKDLAKKRKPGRYCDRDGLYLRVAATDNRTRSWLFQYVSPVTTKVRQMGLGGYPDVSLHDARAEVTKLREQVRNGKDPMAEREQAAKREKGAAAASKTFGECAAMYVETHMAQFPNSMLLVASSPYAKRGALYDAHREHFGKDGDPVLVWQAPTRTMNPTIAQALIDEAMAKDPASAAAEWLGQFRNDIESFISREAVEACISEGIRERAPEQSINYSAFVDPAGGSGKDSFTLAIAHKDKTTSMGVLDCIREMKPPFSPEQVAQDHQRKLQVFWA